MKANSLVSKQIFADDWDEEVQRRSRQFFGDDTAYEAFRKIECNYYSDPYAKNDPIDKPSPLYDQLK